MSKLTLVARVLLLGAALTAGCANRGMQAPTDGGGQDRGNNAETSLPDSSSPDTGGGDDAPADLPPSQIDAATDDGGGGSGGAGGQGGSGGAGGGTGGSTSDGGDARDSSPVDATDGPRDTGGGDAVCAARFNFEGGAIYGSRLNNACTPCFTGFTAVANSTVKPLCGGGGLEITAAFMGTTGKGAAGEVVLPLPTSENLTGKTITVSVAAVPNGGSDLTFSVLLGTSIGFQTVLNFSNLTGNYMTKSLTLTADGGVSGTGSVSQISLEGFSTMGYTGKIYVDEIDIR